MMLRGEGLKALPFLRERLCVPSDQNNVWNAVNLLEI